MKRDSYAYLHGGDSNSIYLCCPRHLYTITCKNMLSSEYIDCLKYQDSDDSKITSIIFTAVNNIVGRQQGFACNGI